MVARALMQTFRFETCIDIVVNWQRTSVCCCFFYDGYPANLEGIHTKSDPWAELKKKCMKLEMGALTILEMEGVVRHSLFETTGL